jgi:hypothetical protein
MAIALLVFFTSLFGSVLLVVASQVQYWRNHFRRMNLTYPGHPVVPGWWRSYWRMLTFRTVLVPDDG